MGGLYILVSTSGASPSPAQPPFTGQKGGHGSARSREKAPEQASGPQHAFRTVNGCALQLKAWQKLMKYAKQMSFEEGKENG